MSQKKPSGFRETASTVFYAILIALAVRTVAYEPFNIPSGSMIPTLLIGDYLFVSKFSYGYSRYSLPFGAPPIAGRIFFTPPERGDVMVFKLPADNSTDYIKRIIGLPGDTVQLKDGVLHINGVPVRLERVDDYVSRDLLGNFVRIPRYLETLPNGREHYILKVISPTVRNTDLRDDRDGIKASDVRNNTGEYKVPEGHYFAMGDNRDNSTDSRYLNDVGYIPAENLIGRAEFLFFSVDGPVWKIWNWGSTLRGERLFQGIE
jgi:signal peptidase I